MTCPLQREVLSLKQQGGRDDKGQWVSRTRKGFEASTGRIYTPKVKKTVEKKHWSDSSHVWWRQTSTDADRRWKQNHCTYHASHWEHSQVPILCLVAENDNPDWRLLWPYECHNQWSLHSNSYYVTSNKSDNFLNLRFSSYRGLEIMPFQISVKGR